MAVRVTFSLDEATVSRLKTTAARLRKPQSQVVREAVAEYAAAADRLGEAERTDMLRALDRFLLRDPTRTAAAVDDELRQVRTARRAGGRRTTGR
jgi:Ribbon-helix-helix protein, copG family